MVGDWVGETLKGRYEIQELVGSGVMSSVYKANDTHLNRVVAVKIIHPHLSSNDDFRMSFIVDLFRSHQQYKRLFEQPFLDDQVMAIDDSHLPSGPL